MLRNYFKIALRTLWKSKLFSLITILGLALGMAAGWMIFRYVAFELSYDQFHASADDTYRVYQRIYKDGELDIQTPQVAPAVATNFQDNFSTVKNHTRLVVLGPDGVLTYQDQYASEKLIYLADSSFFSVFSFPLLQGNPRTALIEPFSIVISESTAQQLFGQENPLGETITIDAENFDGQSPEFEITGVMADIPKNTHLGLGVLVSYPTLFEFVGHQFDDSWDWNNTYTYLQLTEGTDPLSLEREFSPIVEQFNEKRFAEANIQWEFGLQSLPSIHLHSDLQHEAPVEASVPGNAQYVYLLAALALLILLIAYINFINLTTVKALRRAREVGIRKVAGAQRTQLIGQFFLETLLINLIAVTVAAAIVYLLFPILAEEFELDTDTTINIPVLMVVSGNLWLLALVIGSGFYPALILSGYQPVKVLKGQFTKSSAGSSLRKVLVVGQFALAFVFIALTLVASQQVRFMQQQDLGFNPEQIVVLKAPKAIDYGHGNNYTRFQQASSAASGVLNISGSTTVPGQNIYDYADRITVNGEETSGVFSIQQVATSYFQQYDIKILAGRTFSDILGHQTVINYSALKLLGFNNAQEALGKTLEQNGRQEEIIGVVQDFHHQSLKKAIEPILFQSRSTFNYYTVKVQTNNLSRTLEQLQENYQSLFPGSPFEYFFLDEFFNRQYQSERQFNALFRLFSGLAVVIACLGLLALSSFNLTQRTKEIGIRKVLGASVSNLIVLLSTDYLKLIGIALVIAVPVANYFATEWLNNFAYAIDISVGLLLLPGVIILTLTLLTISSQTLTAARRNPVNSLREE
ncbi:ABC transporter permease [Tunicatimonas pelagia]|uniref:ABC transporter permease n=1 Tax=Tunicatimonas pelagia TaxID=931531 RepID=UPI002666FA47|nr:ABC transporter permease [Tunicatimonas pelagia]WKN43081.1 ABC transporter permease [Tunicatimonas pelagia]